MQTYLRVATFFTPRPRIPRCPRFPPFPFTLEVALSSSADHAPASWPSSSSSSPSSASSASSASSFSAFSISLASLSLSFACRLVRLDGTLSAFSISSSSFACRRVHLDGSSSAFDARRLCRSGGGGRGCALVFDWGFGPIIRDRRGLALGSVSRASER